MAHNMNGMYTGTRWARLAYRPANIGLSAPVFGTSRTGADMFNMKAHGQHIIQITDNALTLAIDFKDAWKDDLVVTKDFNLSNSESTDEWEATTLWDGYTANHFPTTDTDLNELSTSAYLRRANSASGGLFQAVLDSDINYGEPSTSGPQNKRYFSYNKPYVTIPDPSKGYGSTKKMLEHVPIKLITDDLDDKESPLVYRVVFNPSTPDVEATATTLHFTGPPGTHRGIIPTNPATPDQEYITYGTGYYILAISRSRVRLLEQVRNINRITGAEDPSVELLEIASSVITPKVSAGVECFEFVIVRQPISSGRSGSVAVYFAGDVNLASAIFTKLRASDTMASNLAQGVKSVKPLLYTVCPGSTTLPNADGVNKHIAVGVSSSCLDFYFKLSYMKYYDDGYIMDAPVGLPSMFGNVTAEHETDVFIKLEVNARVPAGTTLTAKIFTEYGDELQAITISGVTSTYVKTFSCRRNQAGSVLAHTFNRPQVQFEFTSVNNSPRNLSPTVYGYTLTAVGAYAADSEADWLYVDESNPHVGITAPDHKLVVTEMVTSAENIDNVRAGFTLSDPYNHYNLFRTCGTVEVIFQIGTKSGGVITWNNVFWGITTNVDAHEQVRADGTEFYVYDISCKTIVDLLKTMTTLTSFPLLDFSGSFPVAMKITDIIRYALNYLGISDTRQSIPDYAIRLYLGDASIKDQAFAGADLWGMIQRLIKEYIPYYFDIDHQQRKIVLRKFTALNATPLINFDTPGTGIVADNRIPVKYDTLDATGTKVPYIKGSYTRRIRKPEFNFLVVCSSVGDIYLSHDVAVWFNPDSYYFEQSGNISPVEYTYGPSWLGTCVAAIRYEPILSTLFGKTYSNLAVKWVCRRIADFAGNGAQVSTFASAIVLIPNTDDGVTIDTHWRLLRYQDPVQIRSSGVTFLTRDVTHAIDKLATAKSAYTCERIYLDRDPLTPAEE